MCTHIRSIVTGRAHLRESVSDSVVCVSFVEIRASCAYLLCGYYRTHSETIRLVYMRVCSHVQHTRRETCQNLNWAMGFRRTNYRLIKSFEMLSVRLIVVVVTRNLRALKTEIIQYRVHYPRLATQSQIHLVIIQNFTISHKTLFIIERFVLIHSRSTNRPPVGMTNQINPFNHPSSIA